MCYVTVDQLKIFVFQPLLTALSQLHKHPLKKVKYTIFKTKLYKWSLWLTK